MCGWGLTAASAVWWFIAASPADQVFVGVLIVVLAAVSAYASALRPRLRADQNGIAVRRLTGSRRWSWSQVNVRVQYHRRLGRDVAALELDVPDDDQTPGGLIILTRLELGEDPQDVAVTLDALKASAR